MGYIYRIIGYFIIFTYGQTIAEIVFFYGILVGIATGCKRE